MVRWWWRNRLVLLLILLLKLLLLLLLLLELLLVASDLASRRDHLVVHDVGVGCSPHSATVHRNTAAAVVVLQMLLMVILVVVVVIVLLVEPFVLMVMLVLMLVMVLLLVNVVVEGVVLVMRVVVVMVELVVVELVRIQRAGPLRDQPHKLFVPPLRGLLVLAPTPLLVPPLVDEQLHEPVGKVGVGHLALLGNNGAHLGARGLALALGGLLASVARRREHW
jgi:hypothetical protein